MLQQQPQSASQTRQPVDQPLILPQVPNCCYCLAKKFHTKSPSFYCSEGQVSLISHTMPFDLQQLFLINTEEAVEFGRFVRS